MSMQLETYITDLIEGRRKSPFLRGFLHAISGMFEASVAVRNFAFDRHWIKETRVDIPVLSVGNIIAGGAGKTALIHKLGKDLSTTQSVSILLRGYRSEIEKVGGNVHLSEDSRMTPSMCGDEAYLLWTLLPRATFFVGKDRRRSAQRAAYHEADVILLDDGMQYRRLHRDFELVMLHADDLYGKGFYLPRGYLRDSPKRLAKADYVFINHVQDEDHFIALKRKIREKTKAPLIGVHMIPHAMIGKEGEVRGNIDGMRVAVFCGLGKPSSFLKTVKKIGVDVVETLILPDHIPPTKKQLTDLAILAREKGCELVLCSEKDWVKLPRLLSLPLPIAYVKASLEVLVGQNYYDQLLGDVNTLIAGKTS